MRGRRQLTILALLLVLALAGVGVGYGLWSKVLFIRGEVGTGNVNVEWTMVGCFDVESKDVGTTTGWIDPDDPQILHFRVENGYPSYIGGCQVEFTSTGTIPVHVEDIRFIPGSTLTNCFVDRQPSTGSFIATCDQLSVKWADGLCTQMHQWDFLGSSLDIHVEQGAAQQSVYEFSIEVQLNQFNESRCPVP
ncbi:MAG: hypothetical protein GTO14_19555 [Anaerolineales bacterium]|nr:hypothetical protein [Anaerolineales bacterium]